MLTDVPAREAPATPPLARGEDATHPLARDEPVLHIDNIQGNILGGFRKDFQTMLFLEVVAPRDFKGWLTRLVPFIATAREVIAFNELFKAIRSRRDVETRTVQATWINIAFSYRALRKIGADLTPDFVDAAFKEGLAARSADLSDPTDPDAEGHQKNWVVGGEGNEADVVLIVASDSQDDLLAEVQRIEDTIYEAPSRRGAAVHSGVRVIYKQHGATLPQPLTGHEHFGFLDGVSQPGIRGRLSSDPTDVLTPRQNPDDQDQGKPGQDLLWPGEFVFGYQGQDPNADDITVPGKKSRAGPSWGDDGSFLVFRRLRQDVPGFHDFLDATARRFKLKRNQFGAKCIGRWPSGAPIMRTERKDDPDLANDDCVNNNFEFSGEEGEEGDDARAMDARRIPADDQMCPPDSFEVPPDPGARICPAAAHIRKAYPRDDRFNGPDGEPDPGSELNEVTTQTHRLLRRGIPFGEPFMPTLRPDSGDSGDRGLLFLAYQTSIVEQFEFVTRNWFNNPDFKDPGAGHDPILGQSNGAGGRRERSFRFTFKDKHGAEHTEDVTLPTDWVIPTGGGYFFAPSIPALEKLSGVPSRRGQAARRR